MGNFFDNSKFKAATDCDLAIYIQLYLDEFEPCNPIGSNRGYNKTTGVYFSILNLPRRYRLMDMSIFLCILTRYNNIRDHTDGYDRLFLPLINVKYLKMVLTLKLTM